MILQRFHNRHVVLQLSKSWLGFDTVRFFGHLVRNGTFEMSDDRKLATSYPTNNHNADTLATCLFQHFCRFGLFDQLISDPGTDLKSHVCKIK